MLWKYKLNTYSNIFAFLGQLDIPYVFYRLIFILLFLVEYSGFLPLNTPELHAEILQHIDFVFCLILKN